MRKPQSLSCITVCVDYADYLNESLYWSAGHFDKKLVVTTESDKATQAVCDRYGVEYLTTDSFYKDGASFNKARAINDGLEVVQPVGAVLFMDADILLPRNFRENLEKYFHVARDVVNPWTAVMSTNTLYYTHRATVPMKNRKEHLDRLKEDPYYWFDFKVVNPAEDALPWGYFHLVSNNGWWTKKVAWRWMPEHHKGANEYDTEFKNRFPGYKLLPQDPFRVLHLWHGRRGTNWNGVKKGQI